MAQETTAIYAFGVPLYLGLIALEARAARKRGRPTPELPESIGNLSAGLGTVVLGLFLGPILIGLYLLGLPPLALGLGGRGGGRPWGWAWWWAAFGHYGPPLFDHPLARAGPCTACTISPSTSIS